MRHYSQEYFERLIELVFNYNPEESLAIMADTDDSISISYFPKVIYKGYL